MLGALSHLPHPVLARVRTPHDEEAGGVDQLAFLIGGVWIAHSEDGTIEERCTWWLDETVIGTDVISRRNGKVVAAAHGLLTWDPVRELLVSMTFSDAGFLVLGTQSGSSEVPPSWIFDARYEGAVQQRRRITMSRPADDELVITQELRQDDDTHERLGSVTYRHEPDAA